VLGEVVNLDRAPFWHLAHFRYVDLAIAWLDEGAIFEHCMVLKDVAALLLAFLF